MKRLSGLLGFILLGLYAKAQIIRHDIIPDSTFGGGPVLTLYAMQPPPARSEINILWSMNNTVYLRMHGPAGMGEILMNGGYPARLSEGDPIDAAASWSAPTGSSGSLYENNKGNWRSDAADKYLGFRFKAAAGDWHYGWLKMTVAPGATSFTVKEWAYRTVDGTGIRAGELTPTGIAPIERAQGIDISIFNGRIYPLHLEDGLSYAYSITDMQGRSISKGTIGTGGSISAGGFASGLYVIRIQGKKQEERIKFALP